MSEITVEQRITYWQKKLGIGSVWLLQEFNTAYAVVNRVSYEPTSQSIIVEYSRKDTPGLIQTSEVGYFLEYIAHSRV